MFMLVNQGNERENNQRRAASVFCAQQTGPFTFAPIDFSGLTSCFPTWHRIPRGSRLAPDGVVRKKRASTVVHGPVPWSMSLNLVIISQSHPRGGC